jgi:hypothetical protein
MKTLRIVTAALFLGGPMCAAPSLAQSLGSFASAPGTTAGGPAASAALGPFSRVIGRGDRIGGPGWSDGGSWRERRPGRRGHHRWPRHGWYGYGIGIGSNTATAGNGGYFAEGAEAPTVENGQARYAYDRGYPYDHFAARDERVTDARGYGRGAPSCETEWTRDRRTGQQVSVRVCRN